MRLVDVKSGDYEEFYEWWTKKLEEARELYPHDGPECFISVDQFNYICGLDE